MSSIVAFLQLAGAVALLLFGLGLVRDGMIEAFGLRMKMILGFGTRTGPRAFISGLVATLGLQSSTACALLTASFVDRGMIGTRVAQIVLLGANVGTALTAVLVASQTGGLAPVLILGGYLFRRRQGAMRTGVGTALVGLGLMLVSLGLLEHATAPLRSSPELAAFLPLLDNAWPVALAFSAVVAMLCSSSLAGVLLIASLGLSTGLTVVMVLGANLGGAASAMLASTGLGIAARRVAAGNLIVRAVGAAVALPFAGVLGELVAALPLHFTGIAVASHLAFNLILAALIWPLTGPGMHASGPPDPRGGGRAVSRAKLAGRKCAEHTAAGPDRARREVLAIGDNVGRMLDQTRTAFRKNDSSPLAEVSELEEQVDRRQHQVKDYLSRLSGDTSEAERRSTIEILDYVINLEHIGDIIDKGLGPEVRKKIRLGLRFSEAGYRELDALFLMTQENLRMAQTVFLSRDRDMARRLVELKVDIRNHERQSAQRHLIRLREGHSDSRETSSLHLDLLRDLKRINAHAVSVAHPILDEEGLLVESRLRAL